MLELYFHVQAFSGLRVEFNFDFCMFFKWCICVLVVVTSIYNCVTEWTLCMKDWKYDKRHVRSKNHSGCLETSCHVRGPLRNKMATLRVISSRSDSDRLSGKE